MKTVDDIVAEWSKEERNQLKDLIEDCRKREKDLIEISRRSKENLVELTDSLISFLSNLYGIRENANKIGDAFLGIYLRLNFKRMPEA